MAKSQQPAYGKAADYVRQKDRSYVYQGPEIKDRKGVVQIAPGAKVSRRQYDEKFKLSGAPYKTLEQKASYRKQLGFTPGPARGRKGVKPTQPPTTPPPTPAPAYVIEEEKGWRVVEFPSWDEAQLYISGQIAVNHPDDKVMVIAEGYLDENYEGDTPEDMTATRVWRTVTDTTFIASAYRSQISRITANIQNWFREVTTVKVYWRPSRAVLGRGDRNGR